MAIYPAKGRATGGVRCQRLLKGEDALLLAWVGDGAADGLRHERLARRPARAHGPS